MAHTQLTLAQRYKISAYLQASISISQIAVYLNVHRSTIYREIARNSLDGTYHPETAQKILNERKRTAKPRTISDQTWHLIETLLRLDYSPEQVSGHLNRSGIYSVSHEWIYQYVLADRATGGTLWKHLRWSHKKRRKRYGKRDRRGTIKDRISIDQRPAMVDQKTRVGDWELDTATGKGRSGYLVIAVERKTKHTVIRWAPRKQADLIADTVIEMLKPYGVFIKTITVDKGKEFSYDQQIAEALDADVYFAHPYSAWERGLNENTIGLVRQYFPKNRSLRYVDSREVELVQERLNNRPRKTLNYRSPNELLIKSVAIGT